MISPFRRVEQECVNKHFMMQDENPLLREENALLARYHVSDYQPQGQAGKLGHPFPPCQRCSPCINVCSQRFSHIVSLFVTTSAGRSKGWENRLTRTRLIELR